MIARPARRRLGRLRPLLRVHRPRAARDVALHRPEAPALHGGGRAPSTATRSSRPTSGWTRSSAGARDGCRQDALLFVVSDHGFAALAADDELQHLARQGRLPGAEGRERPARQPRGAVRPGAVLPERRLVEDARLLDGARQHLRQPEGPRGPGDRRAGRAEYEALVAEIQRRAARVRRRGDRRASGRLRLHPRRGLRHLRPGSSSRTCSRRTPRATGWAGRTRSASSPSRSSSRTSTSGAATTARSTRRWSTASCSPTGSSTPADKPYMADIMPTLLELYGVKSPVALDGKSLNVR